MLFKQNLLFSLKLEKEVWIFLLFKLDKKQQFFKSKMKIQLQIQNKMVALNFLLFFFQLKYKLHLVREKKGSCYFWNTIAINLLTGQGSILLSCCLFNCTFSTDFFLGGFKLGILQIFFPSFRKIITDPENSRSAKRRKIYFRAWSKVSPSVNYFFFQWLLSFSELLKDICK